MDSWCSRPLSPFPVCLWGVVGFFMSWGCLRVGGRVSGGEHVWRRWENEHSKTVIVVQKWVLYVKHLYVCVCLLKVKQMEPTLSFSLKSIHINYFHLLFCRKNKEVPPSFKHFFSSAMSLSSINMSGTKLPPEALKWDTLLFHWCPRSNFLSEHFSPGRHNTAS